jgi:hypothetical protein
VGVEVVAAVKGDHCSRDIGVHGPCSIHGFEMRDRECSFILLYIQPSIKMHDGLTLTVLTQNK